MNIEKLICTEIEFDNKKYKVIGVNFEKDKIEIEKILDFISQIKILSLQNDFEILPVMDINFDIGLDWKSNINREPWVEALNKVL